MAYEKQNFVDGNVLTADNLNHMEEGIAAVAGFGLGSTAKELTKADNLDNIWQSGNYYWNWSVPTNAYVFDWDTQGAYSYMRVDGEVENIFTQTLRSHHAPMGWNEANEEIAKKEAYNGIYEIIDDGQPEPEPEVSLEDAMDVLLGL